MVNFLVGMTFKVVANGGKVVFNYTILCYAVVKLFLSLCFIYYFIITLLYITFFIHKMRSTFNLVNEFYRLNDVIKNKRKNRCKSKLIGFLAEKTL